ncbi:hypothetical protein [Dasania marina]|uniref:hypothetical protein n=1 Tax=Dasania marina TaxID=471499 RepID=UPI0012EA0E96|nr:hypothetical protein [Dasania marina]
MKSLVYYILVIWIALQSVLAAADAHQVHQSDRVHHETQGELDSASPGYTPQDSLHESLHDTFNDTPYDSNHDIQDKQSPPSVSLLDCQHCCHCHGQLAKLLANSIYNANFSFAEARFVDYHHSVASSHPSSLFRPPRV